MANVELSFFEQQFRTVGFLITIAVFVGLAMNIYGRWDDLLNFEGVTALILVGILIPTSIAQVQCYAIPDTRYHSITFVTLIIGIIYIFVF